MKATELEEAKRDYEEYRTYCNMVAKFKHYAETKAKGEKWIYQNAFDRDFVTPDQFHLSINWRDSNFSEARDSFGIEIDDEMSKIIMTFFETKMNHFKKKLQDRGLEL